MYDLQLDVHHFGDFAKLLKQLDIDAGFVPLDFNLSPSNLKRQFPVVAFCIWVPQNGWFTMDNPIKMHDLGVPLFSETSTCSLLLSIGLFVCAFGYSPITHSLTDPFMKTAFMHSCIIVFIHVLMHSCNHALSCLLLVHPFVHHINI